MQLTSLKLQDCLQYDTEFLAAVYNCLPSKYQDKWLDVEKTTNKWSDMVTFLDKLYDQANEQLVLLDTLGKAEVGAMKKPVVEIHAMTGQETDDHSDVSDDIELKKTKDRRKKAKEEIGSCPSCKEEHTFVRRQDKMEWPSDRLFTCKKFKEMSPKDRGILLEKLKACSMCTSWRHSKQNCPGQPAKCSADKPDNSKRGKDHSYLVHDNGIAYCNAARSSQSSKASSTLISPGNTSFSDVNIDHKTV